MFYYVFFYLIIFYYLYLFVFFVIYCFFIFFFNLFLLLLLFMEFFFVIFLFAIFFYSKNIFTKKQNLESFPSFAKCYCKTILQNVNNFKINLSIFYNKIKIFCTHIFHAVSQAFTFGIPNKCIYNWI